MYVCRITNLTASRRCRIKFGYLLFGLIFHFTCTQAQCVLSGPNSASAAVNNTVAGSLSWSGLSNIYLSDNTYATVLALSPGTTNYLVASNFGFSIPSTATICGIFVEIEKSTGGLLPVITDNSVKIMKGGVITGTDLASSTLWPSADSYFSYGSSSNTWGLSWLPADINAVNFGVAISVSLAGTLLPTAKIDNVRISVYYNNTVLPIELTDFQATRVNLHSASLSWTTATETNNNFFVVQRSTDGDLWSSVGQIKGAGNSHQSRSYGYMDTVCPSQTCYFRLGQVDYDDSFHYYPVIILPPENFQNAAIIVTQDVPSGDVSVQSLTNILELSLYDLSGKKLEDINPGAGMKSLTFPLPDKSEDFYVLNLIDENGVHYFKKIMVR